MYKYKDAIESVAGYDREYRSPQRPKFEFAGPYDLFPESGNGSLTVSSDNSWPHAWPLSDRQGVYIIMNEQLGVCYVGKASMGNCIGSRLSSYFGYESETDRRCKIYHREGWTEKPRYVMCVAVPEDSPFEAPALEEFLIRELAPPDNKRGVPPAVPY